MLLKFKAYSGKCAIGGFKVIPDDSVPCFPVSKHEISCNTRFPRLFSRCVGKDEIISGTSRCCCRNQCGLLRHKVGAAVAAVRRAGGMTTVDTMNHFMLNKEMIVVGPTYWNMVYGYLSTHASREDRYRQHQRIRSRGKGCRELHAQYSRWRLQVGPRHFSPKMPYCSALLTVCWRMAPPSSYSTMWIPRGPATFFTDYMLFAAYYKRLPQTKPDKTRSKSEMRMKPD